MSASLCSIHTHSTFCDGSNSPEEMADAAYAAGVRYFGLSGHSHTPIPYDQGNVMSADLSSYRAELLRLRAQYAGKMEVLLGIEQDSCTVDPVPDWMDYWIGSVHNLYDPERDLYYAMDWSTEALESCRDAMFHGDALAMTAAYFQDVGIMAERSPTILGHIDLITKLNGNGRFFDEDSPAYRTAALEALHRIDPDRTLLEINTGAMSRGYRTVPYPAPFLLKEWKILGGRIILTSDSHRADTILYGYQEAAELARSVGFQSSWILTLEGIQEQGL